jgi:hypothetical protein
MRKASVRTMLFSFILLTISALGQQPAPPAATAIPDLINFSGTLTDLSGKPLTGVQGVTFLLYGAQQGGNPLWMETQNITPGRNGQYTATLGLTTAQGLPADIFSSGEARWLAVQIASQPEQPRILLVAVPYAMKAADAQTLGGLPPSAFVLAAPSAGVPTPLTNAPEIAPSSLTPNSAITGAGTVGYLPLWDKTTDIVSSVLFQSGSGTTAKIGLNNATPAATLDVVGNSILRGSLSLPNTGTATATAGKNSQPFGLSASAFNSTAAKAVTQTFEWLAEPVSNDTANASASLNLLFGQGTTKPAETGLHFGTNGLITFASGQTFPGTGKGTVTSVGLSAPSSDFTVSGSPVTGAGTLNLAWSVAPTSANTPSAIVKRDTSGNFSAGEITASSFDITDGFLSDALQVLSSSLQPFVSSTYSLNGGTAVTGFAANPGPTIGVYGIINSGDVGAFGVFGSTYSSSSSGVFGQQPATGSATGSGHGYSAGVWGDSGTGNGVLATADNSNAVVGVNNSPTGYTTAFFENESTDAAAYTLYTNSTTFGGFCSVDVKGNLACSGSKSAIVPVDGGKRKVALYAVESPQNWFEDFGSAQLIHGVAVVQLDPDFIQTVNAEIDYKVFPVPNGDCKGLYVTKKTATSFEVHELGTGTSNISFDYRVTALRRNYEKVRFADHTNDPVPYIRPKKLEASQRRQLPPRPAPSPLITK